nr:reverse transcriptase domain-containing protein [Tanacetum cinerariifolium]
MSQAAIRKLIADSVAAALETQTTTMAEVDNSIREILVAKRRNYKEFISCQPFYFNGTEGVVGLIHWFKRTELVVSRSNRAKENKVACATGKASTMSQAAIRKLVADSVATALETQKATMAEADNFIREIPVAKRRNYKEFISCQPFYFNGMDRVVGLIRWFERTEPIKKMEDEFYNLSVKGNDLKTYVRRFQELAVLCPNMIPNNEKLMEVFIGGLPRSIEGNVTASKPQTLEEAINIAQRLMDQVTKHNLIQGTNDHKRKFEDKRNISSNNNYLNNYQNISNNHTNDFRQQQNKRPETFRSYAATPTENRGYTGNRPLYTTYNIEMADGNLISTNTVIQGCTLTLLNQPFEIDLMPIKLGSFDIVIGMDWLSKYHAKIICDEKIIHIPIEDEALIIREEYANHLRIILKLLRKDKLYAKFSKCDFWIRTVQFLGHLIDSQGLQVDPAKIEAVKNWASPTTPTEIRQFLRLAGYYRRFIKDFSKIAKSLTY